MKGLFSSQQSVVSGRDIDAVRLLHFKEIVLINSVINSASHLKK